jgi:DNA-binding NarL/FixJ family response regulator
MALQPHSNPPSEKGDVRFAEALPGSPKAQWLGPHSDLRLLLIVRRRLDHLALASLLEGIPGINLVAAENDLTRAIEACRSLQPDAAIMDVSYPDSSIFSLASWLLEDRRLQSVAFLDDRFALLRAKKALSIKDACYFTRDEDIRTVCNYLRFPQVRSIEAPRCSCPSFLTDMAALRLYDRHGITNLTPKEELVMAKLAAGCSVVDVAKSLELSESTVDNHKSRIMKKLGVHRASQLTRLAIEAGVID